MVYSLNKRRRWELPSLLKDSICNDVDTHEDLDVKVLLVENHLDSRGVFKRPTTVHLVQTKSDKRRTLVSGPPQRAADLLDCDGFVSHDRFPVRKRRLSFSRIDRAFATARLQR